MTAKIQPRHLVAAPFLLVAAWLLIEVARALVADGASSGWEKPVFKAVFGGALVVAFAIPGVTALRGRWEEFVKTMGFMFALALFALVSRGTTGLERTVEDLIGKDYPLLAAMWGGCVVFAPWVLSFGSYKVFVPRIIRRIESAKDGPRPSSVR